VAIRVDSKIANTGMKGHYRRSVSSREVELLLPSTEARVFRTGAAAPTVRVSTEYETRPVHQSSHQTRSSCGITAALDGTGPFFHWSDTWQLVINTVTNIASKSDLAGIIQELQGCVILADSTMPGHLPTRDQTDLKGRRDEKPGRTHLTLKLAVCVRVRASYPVCS
jgi:hypothetical protein